MTIATNNSVPPNPYRSPEAPVAPQSLPRPRSIRWAIALLWLAAAFLTSMAMIVTIRALLGLTHWPREYVVNLAALIALLALCARKVAIGRNWARWLIAIYISLDIASRLETVLNPESPAAELSSRIGGAAYAMMVLLATALMFTKNSRDWFRSHRAA